MIDINHIKKHSERVLQIVEWIKEDPSIAMVFNGSVAMPKTNGAAPKGDDRKALKYKGFQAQALRALHLRTLSVSQLRSISKQPHREFLKNLNNLVRRELVTVSGRNITLTDRGKKMADFFVANPSITVLRRTL